MVGIDFDKVFPLFGDIHFYEDGFNRTLRFTYTSVDALGRVNVELVFPVKRL